MIPAAAITYWAACTFIGALLTVAFGGATINSHWTRAIPTKAYPFYVSVLLVVIVLTTGFAAAPLFRFGEALLFTFVDF